MEPIIKIFSNAAELAKGFADEFVISANYYAGLNKKFHIALSGGSTPELFFQMLTKPEYQSKIDWKLVHFYWGDERCVPPEHEESNYGMTRKLLIDHIEIPPENIHRIRGDHDPFKESHDYAFLIERLVPLNKLKLPVFDWIILGIGTDGHTASIFPKSKIIAEQKNICAVAKHPGTEQMRITLTMPVLNSAKRILFLVSGNDKAKIVADIINLGEPRKKIPVSLIEPTNGTLEWYLDEAAAALIENE